MLYRVIKRAIERNNYDSKEDMAEKLSVLYTNNQLDTIQYEELIQLLNNNERGDE
jgi:hypothetical protein